MVYCIRVKMFSPLNWEHYTISLNTIKRSSVLSVPIWPWFLKKEDAIQAGDFRPTSLVHSFAKLVTKILANTLSPHLNQLVSSSQNAFIRGRCIHDNLYVGPTNKVLQQRKIPNLFLKLNISKVFDSVSWSFLLKVLKHLGFGWLLCKPISNLLLTSSTQVLVNGEPGERIHHQRGLRQGNPLSPILFILVMDVLNSLFAKAEEDGLLQPLSQREAKFWISLYTDDVALFLPPVPEGLQIKKAPLSKKRGWLSWELCSLWPRRNCAAYLNTLSYPQLALLMWYLREEMPALLTGGGKLHLKFQRQKKGFQQCCHPWSLEPLET